MLGNFREIFRYNELIKNLVARDLKVRYKNSVLGFAWTWLDPLMTMFIFIIVFDFILAIKTENFPVFLLTGLVPWTFFCNSVNGSVNSIVGNAGLIKRVYYPREIFPLTMVLANAINMFLSLLVLIPVSAAFGIPVTPKLFLLPIPALFLFFFTYGVALIFSSINVFLRDTEYIGPFTLRLWFYLTPIFYAVEGRIPEEYLDPYMMLNPPAVILTFFRGVLMDDRLPELRHILVAFGICIVVQVAGYAFFKKNEDKMVKRI